MACPFFFPVEKIENDAFVIPPRLPLGEFYKGECRAHAETYSPTDESIRGHCNNGYGRRSCDRFPEESLLDAIRFHVADFKPEIMRVQFVFEKGCWPAGEGFLEYSKVFSRFLAPHSDPVVQRQAEVFVAGLLRRIAA